MNRVAVLTSHYTTTQEKGSGNVAHKKAHKYGMVGADDERASSRRKRFYGLV